VKEEAVRRGNIEEQCYQNWEGTLFAGTAFFGAGLERCQNSGFTVNRDRERDKSQVVDRASRSLSWIRSRLDTGLNYSWNRGLNFARTRSDRAVCFHSSLACTKHKQSRGVVVKW
jgi:hypothetical protein